MSSGKWRRCPLGKTHIVGCCWAKSSVRQWESDGRVVGEEWEINGRISTVLRRMG